MRWHLLLLATLVPWVVFAVEPTDVSSALEDIRDEYDVPALAAAAFDEGELVAIGAHGVRSTKRSSEVTDQDLWLLSSCTKSMTASLAAMLVEEGTIHWNSTIADVFPELCDCIDALWNHVTLEQLLVHRGGAPHNPPSDLLRIAELRKGTPAEQRMEFITSLLVREPSAEPGSKWIYSDSGYCIAGAMLERMGGKPYEQVLQERLAALAAANADSGKLLQEQAIKLAAATAEHVIVFNGWQDTIQYVDRLSAERVNLQSQLTVREAREQALQRLLAAGQRARTLDADIARGEIQELKRPLWRKCLTGIMRLIGR